MLRLISSVVRKHEDPVSQTRAGTQETGQHPSDADIAKMSDAWMQRMVYPSYLDYAIYDEASSHSTPTEYVYHEAEPQEQEQEHDTDLDTLSPRSTAWQNLIGSRNYTVLKAVAGAANLDRQHLLKLPRLSSLRSVLSMIYDYDHSQSSTSDRIE